MGFSLYLERFLFLSLCVFNAGCFAGFSYFFYQTPEYPRDCREVRDQCPSSISSGVYLIKPDGYLEPFEVYCDNDVDSGGWTVILRRLDGSLDFLRNWEDYKNGFGFLSGEFWVGNERLSYLTNQLVYELRADVFLSNNASSYFRYNLFRISDEWGKFTLAAVGNYTGDADFLVTFCPQNMIYGNCTCMATCQDPLGTGCQNKCDEEESCICQEGYLLDGTRCVLPSECGCYLSEDNRVLQNGEAYVSVACTEKCICNNNQLNCNTSYRCGQDAICMVKDDLRQCYCNEGYTGDGETCTPAFRDCNDVRDAGSTQDGVYSILPSGWPGSAFNVFCKMTIDGGGWIVFQRRDRGETGFYRNWASYKNGFGDIQDEFWLGNEKLYYLTQQGTYELRVDLVLSSNTAKYAKYTIFRIDSEVRKYRVTNIGTYSGNGGNGMSEVANDRFSTHDQDNDGDSYLDCAEGHRGGWWYGGSFHHSYDRYCDLFYYYYYYYYHRCTISNLNGEYNGGNGRNLFWDTSYNCNVKYTEMKLRRVS